MVNLELLHAYADGELTGAERTEVEAALKADPAAAAELVAIRNTKTFVAKNLRTSECEDVWKACCGRLDEIDKTKRVEGFVSKYAWGLCALFLCVILAGGVLRKLNPNTVRTGQVASYVSGLAGGWSRPPAQPEGRREWVAEKLGQVGAEMKPNQLVVLAGQDGIVDNHHVVRLMMADAVGPLELVVVSNTDEIEGGEAMGRFRTGSINGANCVAWKQNGCAAFLMGDSTQRSHEDLADIANTLK
jgi:anti-sigma factor RsiW